VVVVGAILDGGRAPPGPERLGRIIDRDGRPKPVSAEIPWRFGLDPADVLDPRD